MALMIGCIWHGLDALQGTRAKPGNHLVLYKFIHVQARPLSSPFITMMKSLSLVVPILAVVGEYTILVRLLKVT